jgi:hypothetical protein
MPEPNGNEDRPITLKDLTAFEARIITAIDQRLETLETKLLTVFHGYGERIDLRLKRVEVAESTTAGRVTSLEDEGRFTALELRVIETEKRLRKIEEGLSK